MGLFKCFTHRINFKITYLISQAQQQEDTNTPSKPVVKHPLKTPEPKPPINIEETPIDTSTPAVTPLARKSRSSKKKNNWGRTRRNMASSAKKQLTLPELLKTKVQSGKESESESLFSDKSDNEDKKMKIETVDKPEESKKTRLSCEEDSSAEADDEMESDELVTKKKITSPGMKYKYSGNAKKKSPEKVKSEKGNSYHLLLHSIIYYYILLFIVIFFIYYYNISFILIFYG